MIGCLVLAVLCPQGDWLLQAPAQPARVAVRDADLVLENGLVRRVIRTAPGVATIALDDLRTTASLLRAVEPEALVTLDGKEHALGGMDAQPNRAWLDPRWLPAMTPRASDFRYAGHATRPLRERLAWKRVRPAPAAAWPPPGVELELRFARADGVTIHVHHEVYDGLPLLAKWIIVRNGSKAELRVDRVTSERLACVEGESSVEKTGGWRLPPLAPFTDYHFCAIDKGQSVAQVRWLPDPAYRTQVSYELQTPCLLDSTLPVGPGLVLAPGAEFVSPRTWLLVHDSSDRERCGLALRRALRTLAPWSTENPILMHVRSADPRAVRLAIDQCAEVGFEMVILTFGSGFEIEDQSAGTLARWRELAEYARGKRIELGGYGLLASRSVGPRHDVVVPGGKPVFGASPCLLSEWGERYFATLRAFFPATGFTVFEHDGSYPGDVCAATTHPGHAGLADSQFRQWRRIADFYAWCRSEGTYLNVPDTYLLCGASKLPMGYRETNWSLPRAQQLVHARQNIFDGTWDKAPSMGWMFVPLVEYHGGGPAATIEPLRDHLDTYAAHLANCFLGGVQACWRGPRLFDAPETRDLVARHVAAFRKHRGILESDLIHLRRADGKDIDGWIHVNPNLEEKALVALFNPTDQPITRPLRLPLYYSGLTGAARLSVDDGPEREVQLAADGSLQVEVSVPAGGNTTLLLRSRAAK